MKEFERGLLNSTQTAITGLTFEQNWDLDATGNWSEFEQTVPGSSSQDIEQARTSNTVNEITDIDNTVGTAWPTPSYDRNGNSTSFPKPATPTSAYTATWDAWNRLISIQDGSTTVGTYSYSGNNWRIKKVSSGVTRHYYYSSGWQALEERTGTSTAPERQFVWGNRYVDDLVLRERATDSNGTLDERLYALQDANWNVTTITNTSGAVQERYAYQAYGTSSVLTPTFTARSSTDFAWEIRYGSYRYDLESALYHIRNRYLNTALGNWISRDPIGYEEKSYNFYELVDGNPLKNLDPEGLACWIYFDCVFVSRTGMGWTSPNVTCEYACTEDTTQPRELAPGGLLNCEDIPKPYSYVVSETVLRCNKCKGDYSDRKTISDWAQFKDCSRAQCQKDVKAAFKIRKHACRLTPIPTACKAAVAAAEQLALRACDFCNDP